MVRPKISVVMPVYNAERYLRKTIDSILRQTFDDFEFIIVDDGSADSTWEIMEAYAAQDSRIRRVKNLVNKGDSGARNTGLAIARGEYIAVQDGDDISFPHRFATQAAYLDAHPEAGAVGSAAQRIDMYDKVYATWKVPSDPRDIRAQLLFTILLPHPSMMIRHDLLRQLKGYSSVFVTDYDLMWRISEQSEIHTIQEPLIQYRSDTRLKGRLTVRKADQQVISSQAVSLAIAKSLIGSQLDETAYHNFFMALRGRDGHLRTGDVARLQPLWDFLARDPYYRRAVGPKLVSCAMKNTTTSPSEAIALLRVAERQFNIRRRNIARKYARFYVLDPLSHLPRLGALTVTMAEILKHLH